MGRSAARLLVILALSVIAGSGASALPEIGRVSPQAYQHFWLWPGLQIPAGLTIQRLYVLTASLNRRGEIVHYRQTPPRLRKVGEVVLVIRLEKLANAAQIAALAQRELAAWRLAGNPVRGIQIDFDSGTTALDNYAQFLRALRHEMEPATWLSVTGLMDWGNAQPVDLRQLAGAVDEIVFQTYQGRSTLPGYQVYLEKLAALGVPYRVGVVEGGEFSADAHGKLQADARFEGYVVFLLKHKTGSE